MYLLTLEIINECNLNCTYCYLGEKKHTKMPLYVAINAINMAIHEGQKQYDKRLHIYFLGGEPLLEFSYMQMLVNYSKQKCAEKNLSISFSVTTNGTLINKSIIDFFVNNHFDIKISIDGNEETHNRNRQFGSGKGSYNIIMNNLQKFNDYYIKTGKGLRVAQVITVNNVKQFIENFKSLESLGFKFIETSINHYETWSSKEIKLLDKAMDEAFKYYCDIKCRGSNVYWRLAENFIRNYFVEIPYYSCKAGLKSIFVNTDGEYFTCKEVKKLCIGNVTDGLNVTRIRELVNIKETINDKCLKCSYLTHCMARGCISDNYIHNESIYSPLDVECYLTKLFFRLINNHLSKEQKDSFQSFYIRER